MATILAADDLDADEAALFDVLVAWRAHDAARHGAAFDELFSLLRLTRMGIETLAARVTYSPAVIASAHAQTLVRDAVLYLTVPAKRAELTPQTLVRGSVLPVDVRFERLITPADSPTGISISEEGKLVQRTGLPYFKGAVAAALGPRPSTWKVRVEQLECYAYSSLEIFLGLVKQSQVESLAAWGMARQVAENITVGICFKEAVHGDEFEFTAHPLRQSLHYIATLNGSGRTDLDGLSQLEGDLPWAADGEWAPVVMMTKGTLMYPSAIRVISCSK